MREEPGRAGSGAYPGAILILSRQSLPRIFRNYIRLSVYSREDTPANYIRQCEYDSVAKIFFLGYNSARMSRTGTDPDKKRNKLLPQMAAFLKACADQTRLRLINLLAAEGEVCVCHLVDVLGANQPKVSRHLAYLKRAGLVTDRKDGLWVHYRLAEPLANHARQLIECINSCFAESPDMRRDVVKLRAVRTAGAVVRIARRSERAGLNRNNR
jgi:ArsR family transcriptional regulator, arsenate/arsenite/antimonite-responsive transcriptional repressor